MIDVGLSVVAFIVAIGVLVAVHEYGHFWVARRLGFKVERFSIGFGKPLKRYRGRGPDYTEYWISWLPLGGYVKMLDEREGPVPEAERHRAFNNRPPAHRIAVLLAGPGFNFLFAIVAYWLLFVTGVPGVKPYVGAVEAGSTADAAGLRAGDVIESIRGERTDTWQHAILEILDGLLDDGLLELRVRGPEGDLRNVTLDTRGRLSELTEPEALFSGLGIEPRPSPPSLPPEVGRLADGGPAEGAGIEAGDRIVALNGQPIETFDELIAAVHERPGEQVELGIERGGRALTVELTVGEAEVEGERVGQLGVYSVPPPEEWQALVESLRAEQRYGVVESFTGGLARTWEMSALTVRLLGRMVIGDVSVRNISGPIGIAGIAGESAQAGLSAFLSFLAIVSISLGILNLLPVPILDGGQIVYQLIEWVKGKPLSEGFLVVGQQLGILLMILLMGFVFYNDIARILS